MQINFKELQTGGSCAPRSAQSIADGNPAWEGLASNQYRDAEIVLLLLLFAFISLWSC